MSNWIPITLETLREAKVAKVIDACSEKAKAQGQPDRAPGVIQGVVDTVRRKISSNASNRVDADPARIPKGLRDLAVDMIIARLKMAVGLELKEDERRTLDRAEADLNRIADGKDTIEQPDDAVLPEAEKKNPSPRISARPSHFGREAQSGL